MYQLNEVAMTMRNRIQKSRLLMNKSLKLIATIIFLLIMFSQKTFAQKDTVYVPSDIFPGEGNLNRVVDSISATGSLSNTVFKLELNGYYVLTDSILVPSGEHLTIVAPEPGKTQETSPPQILCTTGPSEYESPMNFMFYCYGNITIRNLWLFYANTKGWQVGKPIIFWENIHNIGGQRCEFENVFIDYCDIPTLYGGSITVACKNFTGTFKNCYWKNCADFYSLYYGRAISFPNPSSGFHIESLVFENCTFANMGHVYVQRDGNYADYVKLNHCTFLNIGMNSLHSGAWYKLSVTNSLFINVYMVGNNPWYSEAGPYGGTVRLDSIVNFGYEVPFGEQERHILFTNSNYFIERWLSDWMDNCPGSVDYRNTNRAHLIPHPQPMLNERTIAFFDSTENGNKVFPLMNRAILYESINPGFVLPPSDTTSIKIFLANRWYPNSAAHSWPWKPENSINRLWPLEENLAYVNDTLLTAGMGGFPLGDLYRWFPDKYKEWKAQKENEDERISTWLETGKDTFTSIDEEYGEEIPNTFSVSQNYPNPFNPSTIISYTLPGTGNVQMKIFDVLGREVAKLADETKSAGKHTVAWNGSNNASGIYFYSITFNNQTLYKKMLMIK